MTIEEMRLSYSRGSLDISDVDPDPVVQFQTWFQQAIDAEPPDWFEVNAMTLSTTDGGGGVSSRIVLLKGIQDGRFCFFTNYLSTKGQQISACPNVALCFFWPHLQRQVRILGACKQTDREQSESYFHKRPRDSQLGALVSRQSEVVANRRALENRMTELTSEYADQLVPCPEHWGGYECVPNSFEFWQGRPSRLHDRIQYKRETIDTAWEITRLSP